MNVQPLIDYRQRANGAGGAAEAESQAVMQRPPCEEANPDLVRVPIAFLERARAFCEREPCHLSEVMIDVRETGLVEITATDGRMACMIRGPQHSAEALADLKLQTVLAAPQRMKGRPRVADTLSSQMQREPIAIRRLDLGYLRRCVNLFTGIAGGRSVDLLLYGPSEPVMLLSTLRDGSLGTAAVMPIHVPDDGGDHERE